MLMDSKSITALENTKHESEKNELGLHVATWMDLKNKRLNEKSRVQKKVRLPSK